MQPAGRKNESIQTFSNCQTPNVWRHESDRFSHDGVLSAGEMMISGPDPHENAFFPPHKSIQNYEKGAD